MLRKINGVHTFLAVLYSMHTATTHLDILPKMYGYGQNIMHQFVLLLIFPLCFHTHAIQAQQSSESKNTQAELAELQVIRLDELARLLEKKIEERGVLAQTLDGVDPEAMPAERATLATLDRDIARLGTTFELIALGSIDTSIMRTADEPDTDWREDLVDILDPVVDSLKSLTERPRQLAELRDTIFSSEERLAVATAALSELRALPVDNLTSASSIQVAELVTEWADDQEQLEQELLVARSQLERLTADQKPFIESVWPATRLFLLGRGLTLLIALCTALLAWTFMKFLWWIYVTYFTSKEQRRNKTWFRLLAYSYYFLTTIVIILAVLVVLYVREDLLLLALALLLIVGAVLSFRQFLPRYVREARLLLNLGSVREDERVVYNGLPWQVMSLNLNSVLRNPALDGVLRLPLDTIGSLVSRPVKNNLWFPSHRNDYVILPDGTFGQVKTQTPDLVELSVFGGMSMTYNTSDFYAINLRNLSRDESFGVSVTIGLDYSLQSISLDEIPKGLDAQIRTTLIDAGYEKHLKLLIVELSSANSSSLDFMVFAKFNSEVAGDYFKLERLLTQACIAVSNERGWEIPFPQLTVHNAIHKAQYKASTD